MLFSYHLLYFCTALSLIIMLSSHYHHHKSKTFSQLTQCPFTGTLLLLLLATTGYRVYRLVLATQPCTLASTTGYRLQSVPAGTGYTALYTCFNYWYWLHSLVHLLQPTGYKSTNRVLATQSLLYSVQGFTPTGYTQKKKKKSWLNIDQ